jgi:hypothetical protein
MASMLRRPVSLACLLVCFAGLGRAQSNLPLGLPADQMLPLTLDGYKLVALDRTKEVIFDIGDKRVTVEVPLFVYVPETDLLLARIEGLKAVHADLGRLASQRDPVDPQRLMTLYLALDRILTQAQVVRTDTAAKPAPAGGASSPKPAAAAPSPPADVNPLAQALKR